MVDRTLKSLQFPQISNVRYLIPQHNLLLYDEIPGTTQSYVYTGSTLTGYFPIRLKCPTYLNSIVRMGHI